MMALLTHWKTYTENLPERRLGIEGYDLTLGDRAGGLVRTGAVTHAQGREIFGEHNNVILGRPRDNAKPQTIETLQLDGLSVLSRNPSLMAFGQLQRELKQAFTKSCSPDDAPDIRFDGIAEEWFVSCDYGSAQTPRHLRAEVYSARSGAPAQDKKDLGIILGRSGYQVMTWAHGVDPNDHQTPGYSLTQEEIENLRSDGILKFWEIGQGLHTYGTDASRNQRASDGFNAVNKQFLQSLPDYTPLNHRAVVTADLNATGYIYA